MCLIFTNKPSDVPLSDAWLRDFYDHNSDGWGFMYYDKSTDKVRVHKALGTEEQWLADFRAMEALQVPFVTHLRMRTHGATDLENVHPYEVNENMYMMHNGILATGYGSSGDKTKSDTWHYVRDHIHPMLEVMSEETYFSKPMRKLIGSNIGNNRFVFMTRAGYPIIINKKQGTTWFGRWMSNTYAWAASVHLPPNDGPAVKPKLSRWTGKWSSEGYGYEDWVADETATARAQGRTWGPKTPAQADLDLVDIEADEAAAALAAESDVSGAVKSLLKPPHKQSMSFSAGIKMLRKAGYTTNVVGLAEAVLNQMVWNNAELTEMDEDVDYVLFAEYAAQVSLLDMSQHLADGHVYLSSLQEVMAESIDFWEDEEHLDTPQDEEPAAGVAQAALDLALSKVDKAEPSAI